MLSVNIKERLILFLLISLYTMFIILPELEKTSSSKIDEYTFIFGLLMVYAPYWVVILIASLINKFKFYHSHYFLFIPIAFIIFITIIVFQIHF